MPNWVHSPGFVTSARGVDRALRDPGVSVHLYDKRRVFERRKMGHVTVIADSVGEAQRRARRAGAAISWGDS